MTSSERKPWLSGRRGLVCFADREGKSFFPLNILFVVFIVSTFAVAFVAALRAVVFVVFFMGSLLQ
jgi:hypothetical protein